MAPGVGILMGWGARQQCGLRDSMAPGMGGNAGPGVGSNRLEIR